MFTSLYLQDFPEQMLLFTDFFVKWSSKPVFLDSFVF